MHERLDNALEEARLRAGIPGVQASIVFQDGTSWSGTSSQDDSGAVVEDTLFAIGSITKMVVAALVMDLEDTGVLGIEDPVHKWLPWFDGSDRTTIRHLLSHTSGLPDFDPAVAPRQVRFSHRRVLRFLGQPVCQPGRCWTYSNANYILLGLVVERAGGADIQDQMQKRFFGPEGLSHIALQGDADLGGTFALGYGLDIGKVLLVTRAKRYAPSENVVQSVWAAGAMAARASDVARFFQAIFTSHLISHAAVEGMTRTEPTPAGGPGPCVRWGLGVEIATADGGELTWGHSGSMPGYRSEVTHFPGAEVTIAVLTNLGGRYPLQVTQRLAAVLRQEGVLDRSLPGLCNLDIYARREMDQGDTRLTESPAADGATISTVRRGDVIAFTSARNGDPQIYLHDLETGSERQLTSGRGPNGGAAWSPDGSRFAYSAVRGGDDEIVIQDVASGQVTQITNNQVPDALPAWSPDGNEIAFARGAWGRRDLWLWDAQTGEERKLTSTVADEWWPTWSPDGVEIAYASDSEGTIEVVHSDGRGGWRRLTSGDGVEMFPAWSSDGTIAFTSDGDVWTMDPDGTNRKRVTETEFPEFAPAWSPDSRDIYFVSDRPLEP